MGKLDKASAKRLKEEIEFVRDQMAFASGNIAMVATIDGGGDADVLTTDFDKDYTVVLKLVTTLSDGTTQLCKMLDGIDYTTGVATSYTGTTTSSLGATTVNFTGGVFTTVLTVAGTPADGDTVTVTPADITDLGRTISGATAVVLTAIATP